MNTDGTAASTARSWCSAAEHGDTAAAVACLAAGIDATDGRAQSRVNRKAVVPQERQLFPIPLC
jgi:hypothetical protein